MKKKKMKGHTGPTVHKHMVSHHFGGKGGMGGKDQHADPLHHTANSEMGGPEGLSPIGGSDDEACKGESYTEGTGGNATHY